MFEDSAFDQLFSVSRVEVIQQISVEELKSIIQQLAKNISDGPKLEDVANLRSDIDVLKGEVEELRLSNQEKHDALLSKQDDMQGLLDSLAKSESDRQEAVEALKAARAASVQHLVFNDAGPPGSSNDAQPPDSTPLSSILDAVDTLVDERLSYALVSDAPISQAKMATSIQVVEDQIKLLAQGHDLLKREISQKADLADTMPVDLDRQSEGTSSVAAEHPVADGYVEESAQVPEEEQSPAACSSEEVAEVDAERAVPDDEAVTEQADTESVAVKIQQKTEAPESSPGSEEGGDGESSQARAVNPPLHSKSDEETGARVTSEISSTDVKSLVQRLMRSSTSIKSDRPAWKRTSDVVAAQTADTILLERLNHLTVKMEGLSESKADCLEIVLLREDLSQLKVGYLHLEDAQQAQRVAAKADRETLTELQLRSALRSTSLAAVSKSRRTSKDVTLKGGSVDGTEAFLGQVKALVDSKADKEEVANLGQMVKRQQSSLSRHSILSTQGMQYMGFQLHGGDPSTPEMHVPLLSELQELQDAVEIVAHVAHAVAVKQLDITDLTAPLYGPEKQDLSTRSRNSSLLHQSTIGATRTPPSPAPAAVLGPESRPSLEVASQIRPGSSRKESPPQSENSLASGRAVVAVLAQDDAVDGNAEGVTVTQGASDASGLSGAAQGVPRLYGEAYTQTSLAASTIYDAADAAGMEPASTLVDAAQNLPRLFGEAYTQTSLAASMIYDAADAAADRESSPAGPSRLAPSEFALMAMGDVRMTIGEDNGLVLAEGASTEAVPSKELGLRNEAFIRVAAHPVLPATQEAGHGGEQLVDNAATLQIDVKAGGGGGGGRSDELQGEQEGAQVGRRGSVQRGIVAALQTLLDSGVLHQASSTTLIAEPQAATVSHIIHPGVSGAVLECSHSDWERLLAEVQRKVALLQRKVDAGQHMQRVADEYGMLTRKPFQGYSCVACDASLPMQEVTAKKKGRFPEPKSVNAHSLPSSYVGPQMPKGGWHAIDSHLAFDAAGLPRNAATVSRPTTARQRPARLN